MPDLNPSVPAPLRSLLEETAGCLRHDYLTGASACIRLTVIAWAEVLDAEASTHYDRLLALKKTGGGEAELYDRLIAMEPVADEEKTEAHSYDGWDKEQLTEMTRLLSRLVNESCRS